MGAASLATHEDLVDALRDLDRLRDTGKVHPAFHFKSRAFLHFHRDGEGATYADVRFEAHWEKVPADNPAERAALLERVRGHIER